MPKKSIDAYVMLIREEKPIIVHFQGLDNAQMSDWKLIEVFRDTITTLKMTPEKIDAWKPVEDMDEHLVATDARTSRLMRGLGFVMDARTHRTDWVGRSKMRREVKDPA